MTTLSPRQIVENLDNFIVGQIDAKKAVAVALRNRWRSHKLPDEMRDDVIPKNILMIGSTGVGKTEIARRLAKLVQAPFIKVEATKFTEVGYVGRDVESIIRDLVQTAVRMVRKQKTEEVITKEALRQRVWKNKGDIVSLGSFLLQAASVGLPFAQQILANSPMGL